MAKEYIEREAATRILTDSADAYGTFSAERSVYLTARERVQNIPAADVVEVVHGKWDDSLDGITPYCSICGRSHKLMVRTPNYCPNCGAKMDGGE